MTPGSTQAGGGHSTSIPGRKYDYAAYQGDPSAPGYLPYAQAPHRDPSSWASPGAYGGIVGEAELFIQPSQFDVNAMTAGGFYRGIPTPGIGVNPGITGIATSQNLLQDSPPTLLERYEITQILIGYSVVMGNAGSAQTVQTELALLVNDRVRLVQQQSNSLASGALSFTGQWAADLINPVWLEARDRLSLRVGFGSTLTQSVQSAFLIAAAIEAGNVVGFESSIHYRVVPKPPTRRLG